MLADVVCVEQVSVDSHFFDDLGANSLVMAHFCARVRKRDDLPSVSMKDIYQHPTIRSLATALADAAPAPAEPSVPVPAEASTPAAHRAVRPLRNAAVPVFPRHTASLAGLVDRPRLRVGLRGSGLVDVYLRSLVFGGAGFIGLCAFPDRGQMDPHRPLEAPRVPRLGSDLSALLDRQGAGPRQPDDLLRRQSAVRAVPAGPRRAHRQGRHDPLPHHSGLHRPAHDRRRHGDPQGRRSSSATGRTPDGSRPARSPSAGTCSSARRPCSTSTRRWATGRSSATPPRCTAARRSRTVSGGTDPRQQRTERRLRAGRAGALRHTAPGRLRPRHRAPDCSCCTCR